MKLAIRCRPEDFQVDESIGLQPQEGPFALYRLTKWGVGTPEALAAICRKWKLHERRVAWAGLKDRHALTTQYLTIQSGPRRNLAQSHFRLEYLGQVPRAICPEDIVANRFRIVVRRLSKVHASRFATRLDELAAWGWPNYFDEQRFGSCGFSECFVAEKWCVGDYEQALWLALTDPYRHDSPAERREKQWLRYHWGQWPEALHGLTHPIRRRVITFLSDRPGDFRRAFAQIPVTLRRIYLSAFQSYLWNALASHWLATTSPDCLLWISVGFQELAVPRLNNQALLAALSERKIALPSARQPLADPILQECLIRLLATRGLEPRQLRVKYPRDSFFSRGERSVWVRPSELSVEVAPDEVYPRRCAVTISFSLPRGAYATMLLRIASQLDQAG